MQGDHASNPGKISSVAMNKNVQNTGGGYHPVTVFMYSNKTKKYILYVSMNRGNKQTRYVTVTVDVYLC